MTRILLAGLFFVSLTSFAQTAPPDNTVYLRWTAAQEKSSDLNQMVTYLNKQKNLSLTAKDFIVIEDRNLALNHFKMYAEVVSGLPARGTSLRVWTDFRSNQVIQAEAFVVPIPPAVRFSSVVGKIPAMDSQDTMSLIRSAVVQNRDDKVVAGVKWQDYLDGDEYVRVVKAKGRRGTHRIVISLSQHKVKSYDYDEFPQADQNNDTEFSVPSRAYQIYEEPEGKQGQIQPLLSVELKYLKKSIGRAETDPYASLRTQRYFDGKFDPVLGLLENGRAQGFWSMTYLKQEAADLRAKLPQFANAFDDGGVILEGRYATVSLHPDVLAKFKGINFSPAISAQFKPTWVDLDKPTDDNTAEMLPNGALLGRPLRDVNDATTRVARRLSDHDPVSYINDGFDELQVYYSINTLFDSLHDMGFTDPELSTRPFNAFMYDPDITMRDNAFYTDDTINFTTYSPANQNFARDNSTIWHELGHGVMDRLMGDDIQLADTGGLSEGMADFVASLVIAKVTAGNPFPGSDNFRIINKTGFNLTNEVHDDGEAYGGAMKDLLDAAMNAQGLTGLDKVTDLTLETMRLTRNHPHLTANDWFEHMLFADSLGSTRRQPGEMRAYVLGALSERNFSLENKPVAQFTLKAGDNEVTGYSLGSRRNPVFIKLPSGMTQTFHLSASLTESETYKFKFPVQVKVYLRGGPLEGAIHWQNEDAQPYVVTLKSASDLAKFDLTATGQCDFVNRPDGTCSDYAYVQIWNNGETLKPVAKKRFYLRIDTSGK